jgi:hypothetical protein
MVPGKGLAVITSVHIEYKCSARHYLAMGYPEPVELFAI